MTKTNLRSTTAEIVGRQILASGEKECDMASFAAPQRRPHNPSRLIAAPTADEKRFSAMPPTTEAPGTERPARGSLVPIPLFAPDAPHADAQEAATETFAGVMQARVAVKQIGPGFPHMASKMDTALPVQRKNVTGLPDTLKAGVEALSGIMLDDVRVRYNSPKAAEIGALAYAQGTDIHVGPGQEEHLPHEAWHTVQQKQGRVRPTAQIKGVAINDNMGLEHEADVMGSRATHVHPLDTPAHEGTDAPIQRAAVSVPVAQLVRKLKTLAGDASKDAWMTYRKPTYTVTGKFDTDHVIATVSKSTAEEASEARFKKDNKHNQPTAKWNMMTWTDATETNILNKATGATSANKAANTYMAKQQLTTKLKNIKKRTVTPTELTNTEARQMGESDYTTFEKADGSKRYVQFIVGAEVKEDMNIVGAWSPEAGTAEIYHYGEFPAANVMLPKYLEWVYDDDEIVGPKVETSV